jgi:hypothetical protein
MEPFSVRVETRAPRDARDVLPDDAADELMDRLADYDGVVSSGSRSWDATVTIAAINPHQAAEEGTQIIEYWAAKSGLPSWPAVRIEAIRQDVLAEQLERPTLPDLVSAPEAADILGVRPQRLHQLADGAIRRASRSSGSSMPSSMISVSRIVLGIRAPRRTSSSRSARRSLAR